MLKATADGQIEDTGPLTAKRMETIDDETTAAAIDFMKRQVDAGTPFFTWMNTTRMHVFTHVRPEMQGQSGMPGNDYADGMIEHDGHVGQLLKALDDIGIADNTIVVYTTDNGPNQFSWPDAATTPFRSEKDTNWEGAFRVPAMVRWPGHIEPGQITNEMFSGLDWFPTLLAAAGDPDIKDELLQGKQIGDKTFKVHLDGYNQLPLLTGETDESARNEFFYFDDDGQLVALRYGHWKAVFCEQPAPARLRGLARALRLLRASRSSSTCAMDPFERADIDSDQYDDWLVRRTSTFDAGCRASRPASSWRPSSTTRRARRPASFTIDQIEAGDRRPRSAPSQARRRRRRSSGMRIAASDGGARTHLAFHAANQPRSIVS